MSQRNPEETETEKRKDYFSENISLFLQGISPPGGFQQCCGVMLSAAT